MKLTTKKQCKTCGGPVAAGMEHYTQPVACTNCWEVEQRLEDYLKSEQGMENTRTALAKAGDTTDAALRIAMTQALKTPLDLVSENRLLKAEVQRLHERVTALEAEIAARDDEDLERKAYDP